MNLGALVPFKSASKSTDVIPREEIVDPFVAFRREVDRLFDGFFDGFGRSGRTTLAEYSGLSPIMDVTEHDKEMLITAELPGLDERDFELTVSGDVLTLKGEKKSENERRNGDSYYTERRYGSFSRSVRLPFEVKDDSVAASYEKGVLTVRIPKPAEMQRPVRRIEVKRA